MKREARSPLATPAIDEIWRRAAARSASLDAHDDAYATSDGRGGIAIGATDTLDDDDALAQLVFHELCHAITEGETRCGRRTGASTTSRARGARARVPARAGAPGRSFGLRAVDGADDAVPRVLRGAAGDPLASTPGDRRGGRRGAAAACARFDASAWRAPIEQALAETAAAIGVARPRGARTRSVSRWVPAESCGTCAWLYEGGRGPRSPGAGRPRRPRATASARRAASRLRALGAARRLRTCGACCREAYHSVTVTMRDPVVWQEPHLIVRHGPRFEILREGSRCAALHVVEEDRSYTCTIYQNRPRPCREFAAGGRHCIEARRRVGLTPTPAARPTDSPTP
jgi:hypothetical protein